MEGDLQQSFGVNLRRYRQAHGINQEDFAATLGVHRTYLGSIERGERNLSLRRIEQLSARLEVEPLSLLSRLPSR